MKISNVFFALICIWTIISVTRVFYNLTKVFTEERNWIFLSQNQRKEKLYGDIWTIYNDLLPYDGKYKYLLLTTSDPKSYILLRYLIYPKKIYDLYADAPLTKSTNFLLLYHQSSIINAEKYALKNDKKLVLVDKIPDNQNKKQASYIFMLKQ